MDKITTNKLFDSKDHFYVEFNDAEKMLKFLQQIPKHEMITVKTDERTVLIMVNRTVGDALTLITQIGVARESEANEESN